MTKWYTQLCTEELYISQPERPRDRVIRYSKDIHFLFLGFQLLHGVLEDIGHSNRQFRVICFVKNIGNTCLTWVA